MLNNIDPAKGKLLISEPFLADPNFHRSVVLLAEHEADGTIGFVLNQRSQFKVKDMVEELSECAFPVYFGGPVATDSLFFVHRCYEKLNSGEEIGKGVFWGGNFETLKILVQNNGIAAHEIKFFIGYSGWESAQLKGELAQNSWIVSEKFHPDVIFSNNEDALWKEVVINMGVKYAHLSNFPADPSLN